MLIATWPAPSIVCEEAASKKALMGKVSKYVFCQNRSGVVEIAGQVIPRLLQTAFANTFFPVLGMTGRTDLTDDETG